MPYTDAQKKATLNYLSKNDIVDIKLRISQNKKIEYKTKAKKSGYTSFNQFIIDAIEEKIQKDS